MVLYSSSGGFGKRAFLVEEIRVQETIFHVHDISGRLGPVYQKTLAAGRTNMRQVHHNREGMMHLSCPLG